MKALAERRARIAKVRGIQHLHATTAAAAAEGKVVQLEGNAAKLTALRNTLTLSLGTTSGAALANQAELGTRLDTVRSGLSDSIAHARGIATARRQERTDAHIKRESAERLEGRAVAQLQAMIEARMAASIRPRPPKGGRDG